MYSSEFFDRSDSLIWF